jgi:hypothetical protein
VNYGDPNKKVNIFLDKLLGALGDPYRHAYQDKLEEVIVVYKTKRNGWHLMKMNEEGK